MAVLTRSQIDAAPDLPKQLVAVPEWGGEVYVRVLTVGERIRLEDGAKNATDAEAVVRLVAMSMCDESGAPLYGDDGVDRLAAKSALALMRVKEEAMRINALTEADAEALAKN